MQYFLRLMTMFAYTCKVFTVRSQSGFLKFILIYFAVIKPQVEGRDALDVNPLSYRVLKFKRKYSATRLKKVLRRTTGEPPNGAVTRVNRKSNNEDILHPSSFSPSYSTLPKHRRKTLRPRRFLAVLDCVSISCSRQALKKFSLWPERNTMYRRRST